MSSSLKIVGKYLDQPILVEKLRKAVPIGLSACAAVYTLDKTVQAPTPEKKKKAFIRNGLILGATIASALAAPRIATAITGKKAVTPFKELVKENTKLIDEFVRKNQTGNEVGSILQKAKSKVLAPKEILTLTGELKGKDSKEFLDKLIPPPENVSSKDIFSEIGWLSIVGAIPVVGGVIGGIAADKVTGENWQKRLPDKIKEGSYQYLANIFLCNVGAGAALGILEKNNIQSRLARGLGMIAGIILTGVIGGSKIANYIGDKFINPVLCNERYPKGKKHKHHDERTPELIDIGLHTDDIATVSLLSGLKWIEPALPILYTVSGYRAGIGYRNHRDKA